MSGRIARGLSLGVLDAVTQRASGTADRTIEPTTNYGVVRLEQELRGGASGVGIVATSVDRSLDSWTSPYLRRTASVGGVNGRHRFYNEEYEVSGSVTSSLVTGTPSAIASTQRNAVHYYQRPDSKLHFDSTRTSLTGDTEELLIGKYGGGITRFETSYQRQSPGYEINDVGYLRRADEQNWSTWGSLQFRTPTKLYNSFTMNGNQWNSWTANGLPLEHAVNTNEHMILHDNWSLNAGGTVSHLGTTYCDRCARGGPAVRQDPYLDLWTSISGDDRQRLAPGLFAEYGRGDVGHTSFTSIEPNVTLRVSPQLQLSLDVTATRSGDNTQWIGNFNDAGTTHYAFAHLDQQTIATAFRVSYIATPELSLQVYAQPFVSNGTYTNPRELTATPRASSYDDRFSAYAAPASAIQGFSDKEFRSNTVVRWEYRPGSTLYFVWTQGRQRYDDTYDARGWTGNYRDLFGIRPDNTFLVKMSYWLSR